MKAYYCMSCKNFTGLGTCLAFPKGIPIKIWEGDINHDTNVKGDNGIKYEKG